MTRLARRLREIPKSATVRTADEAASLRRRGVPIIDLSAGRAPEPTPGYVTDAAVAALREARTHQTPAIGTPEFRRAAAAKLARENGIEADPEREIVATMGVKQGLTLSLMVTVDQGDEVIVEDPCFVSYQPLVRLCGGVPVEVPLRAEHRFRWRRDDLERRITGRTRVILMNSPQNPTGVVHTEEDLDVVAEVARSRDLHVITDEVYERVTWGGRRHVSLATRPGMAERVITVMGLTKTFAMGGWRIGFVHAAPEVCAAMGSIQAHLITCANSFVQAGAAAALGDAPRPEVLDLWADWERRCRFVASELGSTPGVTCREPEGGYFAWANIEATGWDDQALAGVLLKEHLVAVVPGSAFGPSGKGHLRVTCVRSWADIREAVVRIRAALASGPRSTGEPPRTPAT